MILPSIILLMMTGQSLYKINENSSLSPWKCLRIVDYHCKESFSFIAG